MPTKIFSTWFSFCRPFFLVVMVVGGFSGCEPVTSTDTSNFGPTRHLEILDQLISQPTDKTRYVRIGLSGIVVDVSKNQYLRTEIDRSTREFEKIAHDYGYNDFFFWQSEINGSYSPDVMAMDAIGNDHGRIVRTVYLSLSFLVTSKGDDDSLIKALSKNGGTVSIYPYTGK